jgi:hypothetical protein
MKVRQHMDKIERLEALRARLDPLRDFELWFWAGMTAGTHAVNAALHQTGATIAEEAFALQPGAYLMAQADGTLAPTFRPLGDVLHVGRPKVEGPVSDAVSEMMRQMEVIEHYRDPCLREGLAPTAAIAMECEVALLRCLALLTECLAEEQP